MPAEDVTGDLLQRTYKRSYCEWKGRAVYYDVAVGETVAANAAWSYPAPVEAYQELAGAFSFYPDRVDCYVDGELVGAQAGGFYGGWITEEIVGPFKGEPGTESW